MKTEIAELEIRQLKSEGLNFDYEFTQGNYINYVNLCIEKEGYDIKAIISKLNPNEKIIFSLNVGNIFHGSKDQKKDSIYWKHPICGLCIIVQSSEKSLQDQFTLKEHDTFPDKIKDLNEVIEDIQQAQVDAGGRFLRQREIKKMTVDELLQLLLPNRVEFEVNYKPKIYD